MEGIAKEADAKHSCVLLDVAIDVNQRRDRKSPTVSGALHDVPKMETAGQEDPLKGCS